MGLGVSGRSAAVTSKLSVGKKGPENKTKQEEA